jgi:uncharacterized protein (DUF885 family)
MLVDIGIHTRGWSRETAVRMLMETTAQPPGLGETDVDRYFVIGGDEIGYYGWRSAREQTRRNAGRKFDLASFHELALRFGALPQSLLQHA